MHVKPSREDLKHVPASGGPGLGQENLTWLSQSIDQER